MNVTPYLNFDGRCEQALEFYAKAIDARVEMTMRYSDSPEPPPPGMVKPGSDHKIMHTQFRVGTALVMASDGYCGDAPEFKGVSLSLAADDEATARRWFDGLAAGGKIEMPLGKTFWSPCFGMVTDRFGLMWMVTVEQPQ